jgi:hypothetical protein
VPFIALFHKNLPAAFMSKSKDFTSKDAMDKFNFEGIDAYACHYGPICLLAELCKVLNVHSC